MYLQEYACKHFQEWNTLKKVYAEVFFFFRNIQEQILMLLDKRIELISRYPALEEGNYFNIPEEIICKSQYQIDKKIQY